MALARESRPLDLEATMRLMDVADEIRRRDLQVARHLESTDREAIKRHVRERYAALGETPDERLLDQAIDTFLSEQHRFRKPEPGLATTLARWYVHRRWIALRVGLPAAAVAATGLLLFTGARGIAFARARSHEVRVEGAVVRLERRAEELRARRSRLEDRPDAAALGERERPVLRASLDEADSGLDLAAEFLDRYAPGGDVRAGVTVSNRQAAEDLLPEVEHGLGRASDGLDAAEALLATERGLGEARERLDRNLAEVVSAVPPAGVVETAKGLHVRGVESVELRDLESARARADELGALVDGIRDLPALAREAASLHASLLGLAAEPAARDRANALDERARAAVAAGDVAGLRGARDEMRELERVLGLAYEIVVTGGVWRAKDDIRNYYLIVEARDDDGNAVSMPVKNEETGRTETVREWAERVQRDEYDRVAADKRDNGIIDDDRFGVKQSGRFEPERRFADLGQITRW
jgi:hypothetical protein